MIRVATYNIRRGLGNDRRRDLSRSLAVLREIDADVVALQEANTGSGAFATAFPGGLIERETDYVPVPLSHQARDVAWQGNMILVRRSIDVHRADRLELPARGERRGAAVVDLAIDGVRLRAACLHLGLAHQWRLQQTIALLAQLRALERRLPTVIMGDLNEWNANGSCLKGFAREHHICAPGPSFHARLPLFRLDRIITSHELDVSKAGVHDSPLARRASDHLPVWANIALPGGEQVQSRSAVARSDRSCSATLPT